MKRYINRNKTNLSTMEAIVKITNIIAKNDTDHNLIAVDRDYSRYIKILMYAREIYCKWLNDFITVSKMAEHYHVDLISLNSIIAIGKHSSKNHNYILKYYK